VGAEVGGAGAGGGHPAGQGVEAADIEGLRWRQQAGVFDELAGEGVAQAQDVEVGEVAAAGGGEGGGEGGLDEGAGDEGVAGAVVAGPGGGFAPGVVDDRGSKGGDGSGRCSEFGRPEDVVVEVVDFGDFLAFFNGFDGGC
jgi:hypothetical protein